MVGIELRGEAGDRVTQAQSRERNGVAYRSGLSRTESCFVRDGFVVINRFVRENEIDAFQHLVDALVENAPASACRRPNNTLVPLRWSDRLVEVTLDSQDRVMRLADAVNGVDLKWISGYVSIKEPNSPPLWWHQDWWCWDHPTSFREASAQIALLCYLQETDRFNGGLRVLPGSHHKSSEILAKLPEPHGHAVYELRPDDPAMIDHPGQVSISLDAGDAVAIDYRLLHGTHPNTTEARRDCILLSFVPSWRQLPADIRGHLIDHLAQPTVGEFVPMASWQAALLPTYEGIRGSLPVNRIPPRNFQIPLTSAR
jgi:Phytanoyl-CoA dioxygenase (PhyH)